MRKPPTIQKRDLSWRPLDVLAAWPADQPLLVLSSRGARGDGAATTARRRWARWTIFAWPERWLSDDHADDDPGEVDLLRSFDAEVAATRITGGAGLDGLPFVGGWIGYLAYDLGGRLEPAARHRSVGGADPHRARGDTPWPLLEMAWCPRALLFDHAHGGWYTVGEPDLAAIGDAPADAPPPAIGVFTSSLDPDAYCSAVTRTLEYIAAGDIFQANITQRLSAAFEGSTRWLAAQALERSDAWYGGALELPGGRTIVSMSPELFLEIDDASRRVRTRPIKGTRPASVDRDELIRSEKDAAELHMIIDLMRNDLGRVCRFGSVQVPAARTIETHGTVHHGVGEVTGTLREDVTLGDVLRASFPPGSVTGAPKIRAMQIIDELEPVARGPYCGAIGFVSDAGDACFNVAIRTMLLHGERPPGRYDQLHGRLDYAVGGGIVADSDPLAEYRESLDKAGVLRWAVDDARLISAPALS